MYIVSKVESGGMVGQASEGVEVGLETKVEQRARAERVERGVMAELETTMVEQAEYLYCPF